MRNLKKIVAVLLTVALMASMMVSALAATPANTDKAHKLQKIGLVAGDEETNLRLEDSLNRIEGIAFAIRAAGLEEEALAMTDAEVAAELAKFTDADQIPGWGLKYAAYAIKTGITVGKGNGILGATDPLSGPMFLAFVLRSSMGYAGAPTDETLVNTAVDAKLFTPAQAFSIYLKADLLRDDAVLVLYNAAMYGVTKDGTPLITALIKAGAVDQQAAYEAGFVAAPPAPVALGLESVTALNTLQIQLVFNKPVNTDDAKDTSKYEVLDKGESARARSISSASIEADGKTVTLTLAPATPLTNNSNAKVTVKKDFREADGTKLAEALSNDKVAVADTTFPVVERVEAVGAKTLRVFFSEPVTSSATAAEIFSVKSGNYTWFVSSARYDYAGKYVEITLGTNLIDGNVDVKVNSNKIFDFAGLMVFEKTINYTYAKVTAAPVATIDSAKSYEVKVKFDRPVYGTLKVSFGVKNFENYTVTKTLTESQATDTITFDFTGKKLPAGSVVLFVFADSNNPVKDLYGNKFEEASFSVNVNADTSAPQVVSTEVKTNVSFDIKFDESLKNQTEAQKISNYSLTKADGTNVVFTLEYIDADKLLKVKPTGGFADNTEYVFTIKTIEDKEGNKNTSPIVLTFAVGDETAPEIKAGDSFVVLDEGKIYLYFSEAMNEAEMLKKANYMVTTNAYGAATFFALGDKDTITKISDKAVLIDLDKNLTDNNGIKVKVSVNVTDLVGKKLSTTDLAVVSGEITTEQFYIDGAELIAKDKLKIKFNKDVNVFDASDFAISTNGTPVAISAVESINGKEVVVKLDTEIGADAKIYGGNITVSAIIDSSINTKSPYGTAVQASTKTVADKVAPSVATVKVDGNDVADVVMNITSQDGVVAKNTVGNIVITYNEAIDPSTVSKLSFTVGGYTVNSVAASGTTITINVKANDDNTIAKPVVTQVYNISDAAGNVLEAGGSWACR